jgi:hypothetical protein
MRGGLCPSRRKKAPAVFRTLSLVSKSFGKGFALSANPTPSVAFIDENGGGAGVRLQKPVRGKGRK